MPPIALDSLRIAGLYAGLLVLMGIVLAFLVIRQRFAQKVSLGDGGSKELMLAMRVHGNFVEHMAPTFACLLLLALMGAGAGVLHAFGLCVLAGRVMHAIGLGEKGPIGRLRQAGMIATQTALIGAALWLIAAYLA